MFLTVRIRSYKLSWKSWHFKKKFIPSFNFSQIPIKLCAAKNSKNPISHAGK